MTHFIPRVSIKLRQRRHTKWVLALGIVCEGWDDHIILIGRGNQVDPVLNQRAGHRIASGCSGVSTRYVCRSTSCSCVGSSVNASNSSLIRLEGLSGVGRTPSSQGE